MSRIEKVNFEDMDNSIDCTRLTDRLLPKSWKCPHCGRAQRTGIHGDEILIDNFIYLEHCGNCGYVHYWKLTLTEDFKKRVIDNLLRGNL